MSIVSAVSREFSYFKFFLKLVGRSRSFDKKKSTTVADIMEEQVDKTPDNTAIEFEDKKYTYREMDAEANQIANWAINKGYKTGDVISLLMENKPEYIIIEASNCYTNLRKSKPRKYILRFIFH